LRIELAILRGELEAQTRLLEARTKLGGKDVSSSEQQSNAPQEVVQNEEETPVLAAKPKLVPPTQIDGIDRSKAQHRDDARDKAEKSLSKRQGHETESREPKSRKVDKMSVPAEAPQDQTTHDIGKKGDAIDNLSLSTQASNAHVHSSKQPDSEESGAGTSNCSFPSSQAVPMRQADSNRVLSAQEQNILEANEELRRDLEEFETELPALKRRRAGSRPQSQQTTNRDSRSPEIPRVKPDPWQQLEDAVLKRSKYRTDEGDRSNSKGVEDERKQTQPKAVKQGGIAVNALRSLFSTAQAESAITTRCAQKDLAVTIEQGSNRMRDQSGEEQDPKTLPSHSKSSKSRSSARGARKASAEVQRELSPKDSRSKVASKADLHDDTQSKSRKPKNSATRDSKLLQGERSRSEEASREPSKAKEDHDSILGKFLTSVRFGAPPGNWGDDRVEKALKPNPPSLLKQSGACPWANRLGA
jgi:hypothetical protein